MPYSAVVPIIASSGLPGTAGIAALAGGPAGAVAAGVITAIQLAKGQFGKGRREADVLSPVANQVEQVLNTLTAQARGATTIAQLQEIRAAVVNVYAEYDTFTRDPKFTDGRASKQARDTMRPNVDGKNDAGEIVNPDYYQGGILGFIDRRLVEFGGPAGPAAPGAAGSAKNNNSGGVLLIGAGIAPKLLGFI